MKNNNNNKTPWQLRKRMQIAKFHLDNYVYGHLHE